MATITLKNVPEVLHQNLKRQARAHKRSLNQESLLCIEKGLRVPEFDAARVSADVRAHRARLSDLGLAPLDVEAIRDAIQAGRA